MFDGYVQRYYHPYILLLYGWLYLLSAWLTHVALVAHLRYDPLLVMPFVHVALAATFLLPAALRVPILDLWKALNLREQFGYFLICATFFFAPVIVFHRMLWPVCFVMLQFPLLLTMVDRAGFTRVYANLLALLAAWCLQSYAQPKTALIGAAAALAVLCACFALDYHAFRYERVDQGALLDFDHIRAWLRRLLRAHWIALQFYLCALALALALFRLTPRFNAPPAFLEVRVEQHTLQTYVQPRVLTARDMTRVVYLTGGLLFALLVLLAVAWYLRRYLVRVKPRDERKIDFIAAEAVFEPVVEQRPVKKPPPARTPREALLRHYHQFCDRVAAKTRPRRESETAGEFQSALNELLPNSQLELAQITGEFERVKYSPDAPSWERAARYQTAIQAFINRIEKS